MATKKIRVCDNCQVEVDAATGGWMRVNFFDGRRGSKYADLCGACISALPGTPVARRGRPVASV